MTEILSFAAAKKQRAQKNSESKAEALLERIFTATEVLLKDWIAAHTLDSGIDSMLSRILGVESSEYLQDLNLIASLESKFQIQKHVIYSPGTFINADGWMVTFSVDGADVLMENYDPEQDNVFMTPEMQTENQARVFALLLYSVISGIIASHEA
jgi:hypothetical protein